MPVVHVESNPEALAARRTSSTTFWRSAARRISAGHRGGRKRTAPPERIGGAGRAGRRRHRSKPADDRKSRVVAHNQQIVRYDVERRNELSSPCSGILRYVESRLKELSCLVVSDYAKGVVTASLMTELTRLAGQRKIPIVVDPKVEHFSYYKGVTVVTPTIWRPPRRPACKAKMIRRSTKPGMVLRQRLGCQTVLVTRGERGMSVYQGHGDHWHIPTRARQVYDVTGAGDTVVGTLALALRPEPTCGRPAIPPISRRVVVGMVGTATVTAAN